MGTEKDLPLNITRALVTGGGGFVGKAVVKRLLSLGIETRVIGRQRYPELTALGVSCFQGSITDKSVMLEASKNVDMVFHVAALAGVWGPWKDYYETNVIGTRTVIWACKENGVPSLVYTSTPSVVFDREHIENGDEQLPYPSVFLCNYAKSKVMAEKQVLSLPPETLKTCTLRPHLIWGPGDPHLIPRLVDAGAKRQLKRVGDGTNLVDISYIDNVAEAHILAGVNLSQSAICHGKAYFISQGEPVNLWDWINNLFEEMNIPAVNKSVSYSGAYRMGSLMEKVYGLLRVKKEPKMTRFLAEQLAKSHYFSIANARRDLGYSPIVSDKEGLRRTILWLKNRSN